MGASVGERKRLYKEGNLIVQDFRDVDGSVAREVVFTSQRDFLQSQKRIVHKSKKAFDKNKGAFVVAKSPLMEKKKNFVDILDRRFIVADYLRSFVAGLALVQSELLSGNVSDRPISVLILGNGAGTLAMFLHEVFGTKTNLSIKAVDISEQMSKIASEYFGFYEEPGKVELVLADALKYVSDLAPESVDLLFIDISDDSARTSQTPPRAFLETAFLDSLKSKMTKAGLVTINTVCYK